MKLIGLGFVFAGAFLLSNPGAAQTKTNAQSIEAAPFGAVAPLEGSALSTITGRSDTSLIIRAQNSATVSNNTVSGQSQTGTISFDAQAFANLNGLSLLSANTGNNVSINSSLNLNVAIQR